ncbi:SgcJ/EcaC family oxidoreductase [Pleionea sp. CnH1-48]|uniref:SgcJ/EcaC family oxidoreductase n=1 Tax=Pleionea sp. CnH1-48 TaxID=2954494 RepID=UPI002097940A|nr:SgcJ/EcaC family oxidoreductase [Pleionea sp. CnH1-48]
MTDNEIISLFDDWNQALQTGDPQKVVALYDENAILLPTISNQVRRTQEERADYFVQFLAKGPKGELEAPNVRIFNKIAINSGVYNFSFNDGSTVKARYTFVYQWNGEKWLIIEHHSSAMPE